MSIAKLKIISAGAGSGKTYRLTGELSGLLASGSVRAAGIIATTFTKKAAAELKERVRVKLLEEGLTREANELTNALIGTVHGLGVKLLQRFAFEAGVSPEVEIIADEDHQRLFNLSMAAIIPVATIEELEALSTRLGLSQSGQPHDWRKEVRQLVEVIRANDFSVKAIEESKQKSWESFVAFLPPPSGPELTAANNRLQVLLNSTKDLLETNELDSTKKTLGAAQKLGALAGELRRRGQLSWPDWAGLCGYVDQVGAKSRELVADLVGFAQQHTALPAFQHDIRRYIELIFDCSCNAIQEYDTYKKKRGQIDYTDMEVLVLRLLENPIVSETLAEELDLLMVDEFQDTSPIQLALFLRLSELAKQSIWVGDPKQSIYGFRGAEPELMAAVIRHAGGIQPENIQEHSWRSREDLVYAANAIFVRAFPDIPTEEVRLIPQRTRAGGGRIPAESTEQAATNGLLHWHYELDGKGRTSAGWLNDVLARSVKELLANPLQIRPKGSKEYRALEAADIAILCRSNYGCEDVARALQSAGIPAAVARKGLLETAESVLVLACLKYMLSGEDSLSVAEIMLMATRKPLEAIIDDRLDYLDALEKAENKYRHPAWGHDDPFILLLDELREHTQEFSPAELLNHVLEQLDIRRTVVAWGGGEQRLSNLDELRRLALAYEENCHRQQQAASIGGFLLYLARLNAEAADKQGAGERPEAVNVLTYHRSKGLEWPVVICHNLEQKLRADLWGLNLVSEATEIDPRHPLANRWLRFWVNPYGKTTKDLSLLEALEQSDWQTKKTAEALGEEARLLYVGITRARDYLIFPTRKEGAPWLDRVYGSEKVPVLDPYDSATPFIWEGKELDKTTQTWVQPPTLPVAEIEYAPITFMSGKRPGRQAQESLSISEELIQQRFPLEKITVNRSITYFDHGGLLPELLTPEYGKVLSAFILADEPKAPIAERLEMANGLIERFNLPEGALAAELLSQSEAFAAWLTTLGTATLKSIASTVSYQDGIHTFDAVNDLLLETTEGNVLINNHLITSTKWEVKASKPISVASYHAWVVNQLHAGGLERAYLHLPLQGVLLPVHFQAVSV